ncbi:hypothetical protein HY484_00940 [Candidatus Woesearchaeota archaeon]|nr:hypothetical protein [Candidatus Woesearchaeota archaeon]
MTKKKQFPARFTEPELSLVKEASKQVRESISQFMAKATIKRAEQEIKT